MAGAGGAMRVHGLVGVVEVALEADALGEGAPRPHSTARPALPHRVLPASASCHCHGATRHIVSLRDYPQDVMCSSGVRALVCSYDRGS
ncbi:hypothetical protein ACP70R_019689 [Stipagrostis hirtigluma subsp. patula]